jgi:hypothetical protein
MGRLEVLSRGVTATKVSLENRGFVPEYCIVASEERSRQEEGLSTSIGLGTLRPARDPPQQGATTAYREV